jgi:hypothetical protein
MSFDHELSRATQTFSKNLHVLAQQQKSQLLDTVRTESMTTLSQFFDRIGDIEMIKRVSRHQDTAFTPLPFSRRKVDISDYEIGDLIDQEEDAVKTMYDPQSATSQAFVKAANRNIDKIIVNEGLLGKAIAADSSFGSTSVNSPASVAADTTYRLGINKIKDAIERLGSADIDLAIDKPYLIISYAEYVSLLKQSEFINKDFKTSPNQELTVNNFNNFLGIDIKIVSSKVLPLVNNNRTCVMYTKSSCLLGIQNQFKIDAGKDYGKGGSVRVIGKQNIGAVRMEEDTVVPLTCDQTKD